MDRNAQTVMAIYDAFGRGDVPGILAHLDGDVSWDEGIRPTTVPYLQPGRGLDHVVGVLGCLASTLAFDVFEPGPACSGDDTVMVPVRERARNLVTGIEIPEDTAVHLWRFGGDGKVAAFRHLGDWTPHERAGAVPDSVPASGRELSVGGETVTVLQSGGEFEVFELTGPAESGPPPHAHPWVESYFVLGGSVEITTDQPRLLAAGDFATVPAGAVHSYRLVGADCRVLVMTTGSRASQFFAEVDATVPPGPPTEASLPTLIEVAKRNGLSSPLFA
jgi:quercetin dioxygenase-like cupin family protein/ketosteroid isomerase-like protein